MMMAKKEKEYILFSPIGDTDPIRGCYDGACLHIIRYYRPKVVYLFFTKDMAHREHQDHRYTRAIKQLAPQVPVHCEFTEITDPQNFDCFNQVFPERIHALHRAHKQAQLLLNLSSGTPQMKNILALLATEYDWCTGVQVVSPERASNRKNFATQDHEDIDALLENNFDNEITVNRCVEPNLHVIRFFREKSQILSLIEKYEYAGAYEIAKTSSTISANVKKLLRHGALRSNLLFDEAAGVLSHWQGKALLAADKRERVLLEYYYLMKIDQQKGRLPELMVKLSPFLFEYLLFYVQKNDRGHFLEKNCREEGGKYIVYADSMDSSLKMFFNKYFQMFRGGDLSFYYLWIYCCYMKKTGLSQDRETHHRLMQLDVMSRSKINRLRQLRNEAAHTIVDIDEEKFAERTGLSSTTVIDEFGIMMNLLFERQHMKKSIYEQLSEWIEQELQKGSRQVE